MKTRQEAAGLPLALVLLLLLLPPLPAAGERLAGHAASVEGWKAGPPSRRHRAMRTMRAPAPPLSPTLPPPTPPPPPHTTPGVESGEAEAEAQRGRPGERRTTTRRAGGTSTRRPAASTTTAAVTTAAAAAAAAGATTTTTKKPLQTQSGVKIPTSSLTKPTKYHYYPHNQHIYLLPECAVQQVCNAVYVRLNFTQPLCACPSRYRDPCSASLNADDAHTTELVTDRGGKALTLVKTCEPVAEMRVCRAPRDWSLLALQNIRTGKSHYLVICRCPAQSVLEGPTPHDQPTYASVPGIRVFGMTCVQGRRGRPLRLRRAAPPRHSWRPAFPWERVRQAATALRWDDQTEEQLRGSSAA